MDITEIKNTIVKNLKPLNPHKVILFGSYAYGNPNIDSDLDLCILDKEIKSKKQRKQKIREALKDIKIAKDILVERYDYFLEHSTEQWINTALYDAKHYGEVLYEKE